MSTSNFERGRFPSPRFRVLSDLKPCVLLTRGLVSSARSSQGRAFFARRSALLTARTDDRPSGYQRTRFPFMTSSSKLVLPLSSFGLVSKYGCPAKLLSVSDVIRAPHALCAKPAWRKPPHLMNRDSITQPGVRALAHHPKTSSLPIETFLCR